MSNPAHQFATWVESPVAEPIVFQGHLGWLHRPVGPQVRRTGILICVPPGRDGRCLYRPLLILADQLCALGFPVLRYELAGEGDSADLAPDADGWAAWIAGVGAAAETLKQAADVRTVSGLGFRLSAALLAHAPTSFHGLALLAPVSSGRQHVRELKLAAAMSGTGSLDGEEGLESEGFRLGPTTLAQITALSPSSLPLRPQSALVAQQKAGLSDVATRLQELGSKVTLTEFPGYEALLDDTHSNQPPQILFDSLTAWFDQVHPELSQATALPVEAVAALELDGSTEHPLRFGQDLSGILSLPRTGPGERLVIFCNTSKEPKSGVGRFSAHAARTLAAQGIAALRFDFAGMGESPGDGGHVYESSRAADFAAALDLAAERGYRDVTLVGVCSGAYHTLKTLVAEEGVAGAFLVSPKLDWRPGESLVPALRDQGRATGAYVQGIKDPKTWARLLSGRIDVLAVLKTLSTRLAARLRARFDDAAPRQLQADLVKTAARGARMHILTGLGDSTLDEIETYLGQNGSFLSKLNGMSLSVVPDLDHGLARASSQAIAISELVAFLRT